MRRERSIWTEGRVIELAMLAGAGGTPEVVAEAMGLSVGAVREAARRRGIPLATPKAPACDVRRKLVVLKLRADVFEGLQPSAEARKIDVPSLLELIAEAHSQAGPVLTDNVLDDGGQG